MSTSRPRPSGVDGLAAVHRLDDSELARFLLQHPRDAENVFRAFARFHFAPRAAERSPCRLHRRVHISSVAISNFREHFFRRGIDRLEIFSRARRDKFPADVELVAFLDGDVVGALGRGRVSPKVAKIDAPPLRSFLAHLEPDGGSFGCQWFVFASQK
jgi:hypothetical protein